jgi:hypothetical protein
MFLNINQNQRGKFLPQSNRHSRAAPAGEYQGEGEVMNETRSSRKSRRRSSSLNIHR